MQPKEVSEVQRAFSTGASNFSSHHMDPKDDNFSVFSNGANNFSFLSGFSDEGEGDRDQQTDHSLPSSNQSTSVPSTGAHRTLLASAASGAKLPFSSISKVIPALTTKSTKAESPSDGGGGGGGGYGEGDPDRSSTIHNSFVAEAAQSRAKPPPGATSSSNEQREKSANEKQMISQNKFFIRHRFEDEDEKGNTLCKFQCLVYWSKQFEAVRQCYFNEADNENYIRSLSTSNRWTAQGNALYYAW